MYISIAGTWSVLTGISLLEVFLVGHADLLKVYSCGVQELVNLISVNNGNAGFPYYPAPDNAPGGCSCNLELVGQVVLEALTAASACLSTYGVGSNDGCLCCAQAGACK